MAEIKLPTMSYKEIGEKGARYALDEVEYKGLTIRQWADKIAGGEYAPVVHGKWKATGTFKVADYNYTVVEQRCSACGHCSIRFKNKAESNYCPKCGAEMDEVSGDE